MYTCRPWSDIQQTAAVHLPQVHLSRPPLSLSPSLPLPPSHSLSLPPSVSLSLSPSFTLSI